MFQGPTHAGTVYGMQGGIRVVLNLRVVKNAGKGRTECTRRNSLNFP
jgi:hypothetical protein